MKDAAGLEVTTNSPKSIEAINALTELFFRKTLGIDTLLPSAADADPGCPMLQIYAAIMYFFSFSSKTIQAYFPTYLSRIGTASLNEREALHFIALQLLQALDLGAALDVHIQIVEKYPQDTLAILMVEACGFLSGRIDVLLPIYDTLLQRYHNDSDFLGMHAFLLSHLGRLSEARRYTEKALAATPHNAWVQHVYAHTLDETRADEIALGIGFLEASATDWPKQSRFFEGHNWMHLCGLYLAQDDVDFDKVLTAYREHIWGEAKAFNFEQNNAFWVLWQADLHGHGKKIPAELRADLAAHAEPFMYDYVTPYLTVSAILSVAQYDIGKAIPGLIAFEAYVASLPSPKKEAWQDVALPVLKGCMEYLKGNFVSAQELLASVTENTRPMGHSDEQRVIFSATLHRVNQLLPF